MTHIERAKQICEKITKQITPTLDEVQDFQKYVKCGIIQVIHKDTETTILKVIGG